MDIHGIYVVYPWIFLDIPFWNQILRPAPRRAAGLFKAHTCVGDQECFIPRATMAILPGDKEAHKRLNPTAAHLPPLRLSLAAEVTLAAAAV